MHSILTNTVVAQATRASRRPTPTLSLSMLTWSLLATVSRTRAMAVTTASAAEAPPGPGRPRYNVLMLAIDDLRASFGTSFNDPEVLTPHLDDLARASVTFTRSFCQAATCGISRSSLLTSRRPDTTRVLTNSGCPFRTAPSHASWVSLPRHFRDQGYITQGMGKIFHPGVCDGLAAGEDARAWSRPYYHAPAPYATSPAYLHKCNCSVVDGCPVGGTECSCPNGSFLDGDWLSSHPHGKALYTTTCFICVYCNEKQPKQND